MNKMKLLIVDDEKDLCRILADRLHILYGITPDIAYTGDSALEMSKKVTTMLLFWILKCRVLMVLKH